MMQPIFTTWSNFHQSDKEAESSQYSEKNRGHEVLKMPSDYTYRLPSRRSTPQRVLLAKVETEHDHNLGRLRYLQCGHYADEVQWSYPAPRCHGLGLAGPPGDGWS